jgi:hypothetical protein
MLGVFGIVDAPEGRPLKEPLSGGYDALKRGDAWELYGRCTCDAERGPMIGGPRDVIWRLEARAWPLAGRPDLVAELWLWLSSTVLVEPIERIDNDLLWPLRADGGGDLRSTAFGDHGIEPARAREVAEVEGTLRERLDRWWPRPVGGGARPALALDRPSGDEDSDVVCLEERSCPGRGESLDWLDDDGRARATFRNVIVHFTSSPAKTVWSCQRMKTLRFPAPETLFPP